MSEAGQIMAVSNQEPVDLVVSDKSIELIIAEAERRAEVLKKVLTVAIKRTNPTDWVDQNGKPYLGGSGCEKIAPLFGLKMEGCVNQRNEREDEKGKYYIYTFMARFHWAAGDIEAIGTCSSRDKFFAWDKEAKGYKPLYEVDETNIMKAAYTNLTVNGVTRALGIRSLTWEDLERAGLKRDSVAKVEYNKGANTDPALAGLISEAQCKRFHAIASKAGWAEAELKEWLLKNYKLESSKNIPWKQYDAICNAVQVAKGAVPGA
jgi:hypothetical protein